MPAARGWEGHAVEGDCWVDGQAIRQDGTGLGAISASMKETPRQAMHTNYRHHFYQ